MASRTPEGYLYYEDDYQFPKEQADAIIRTTSYHRKDFDLAVIWFSDREHQGVRTSIFTSSQRAPSASPGALGRLPQELLENIFLSLDMHSLTNCRQVNLRLRQAIDSLPEYQAIYTHALNTLCALLRTRLAHTVSLFYFYQALCTKNCDFCRRFAGCIFLPTWRRCCFICLERGNSELQMQTVAFIQKRFPLLSTAAFSQLTSVETLPGTYSMDEYVQKDSITIVPVEQAMRASREQQQALQQALQQAEEPTWFQQDRKLAFMASCALPYYDRQNRTTEYGISCAGDQVTIDKGGFSALADKFGYKARDTVYTKDSFLVHFKECEEAQLLWGSSKEGSIEPPNLPPTSNKPSPIANMGTSEGMNELLHPKIISMEVDDEDSCESEYRLQIGTQVKYLIVDPGTYDRDTLSFPLAELPPLQYDADWTVAHISRSPHGTLLTSLSTRKLASVKSLWHPTRIDYFDLEKTAQLTAAAYEAVPSPALASTLGISPSTPVIAKIARFEWEIPRLEQETHIYHLLSGSGLTPRFLGHIREGDRVIGGL
ncbi:hypothetical protein V502_10182 [Pseudogymnoascus sp. VKM F-4520 (FW-2644)]|nr:hypothetical protein V502_10182 [Pseudogymnoascus sp. VKM F-4520 (FW-2644)]